MVNQFPNPQFSESKVLRKRELSILNTINLNKQLLLTSITIVVCLIVFEFSGIDLLIEDFFFDVQLNCWMIDRHNALLKFVFYDSVKGLYVLFMLSLLAVLIFFRKSNWVKANRQGLLIVFLSVVFVPLIIGTLKSTTNVPCPKNIEHYGGNYPYVTVTTSYPASFHQSSNIECYPAGHASGGFALMALFFLFNRPSTRRRMLIASIATGWVIGTYKMLIGDHFLSHTVMSMLLAWFIILLVSKAVYAFYRSTEPVADIVTSQS